MTTPVHFRPAGKTVITASPTVLIVEPVPAMARLLSNLFEELGYSVIPARGPSVALTEVDAAERRIDVVVTELALPDVSGQKLAVFIHQRLPHTPILILCDQAIARSGSLPPTAVLLEKPFTRDQLTTALGRSTPLPN